MTSQRVFHAVACTLLFTAATGLTAFAESTPRLHPTNTPAKQPVAQQQRQAPSSSLLFRAGALMNATVTDKQGNELGTIKNIAVDINRGQAAFAIIELGAWSGSGKENLYAVPFEAVHPKAGQQTVTLAISRDQLKQAAGFSNKTAPDMNNSAWAAQTARRYGYQPYWMISYQGKQPPQPVSANQRDQWLTAHGLTSQQIRSLQQADFAQDQVEAALAASMEHAGTPTEQARSRAKELAAEFQRLAAIERHQRQQQAGAYQPQIDQFTELVGMRVQNRDKKKLGSLRDLVVDGREDQIAYAILGYGGILGMGAKLAPVPYAALQFEPKQKLAVLDADKDTLKRVSFKPSQWPNLENEQWAMRVHQAFNQQPYWQVFGYGFYSGEQPQTITGKIMQVAQTPQRHVQLTVKAKDGETYLVDLAPVAYLEKANLAPKTGQKVTVTGLATYQQNQTMVQARSITWKGKTVELRDAVGQPKWHQAAQ